MNPNQTTGRSYTEVAAGGSDNTRWEPTKNENNPSYPKQIEGYYKSSKELPGKNGSFMVSEIQMVNPDGTLGQLIDVSGGKVLEEKLRNIPLGSFIMIQYKGKVQGKLNAYNDWATFVDENAVPLHQLMGMGAPAPVQAFQQAPVAQQQAPVFNQQPVQNKPFGNTPAQQNAAPVFNQQTPVQNAPFGQPAQTTGNPVFNQPSAQNNGQMPGVQQGSNPFAQQNGDLPF